VEVGVPLNQPPRLKIDFFYGYFVVEAIPLVHLSVVVVVAAGDGDIDHAGAYGLAFAAFENCSFVVGLEAFLNSCSSGVLGHIQIDSLRPIVQLKRVSGRVTDWQQNLRIKGVSSEGLRRWAICSLRPFGPSWPADIDGSICKLYGNATESVRTGIQLCFDDAS
jgi:hypothetical protein